MSQKLLPGEDAMSDPTGTNDCRSKPEYHPTLVTSQFFLISLFRQLWDRWRNPIPRVPEELTYESNCSQPREVKDLGQDFRWQPGSLLNSLLLHVLVIAALSIPFVMTRPKHVTADAGTFTRIYYTAADVPALAKAAKDLHGGGGGGDESLTPASRGRLPRFAREQLAPPSAKTYVITPKLAVMPTMIGPPEIILPQMEAQLNWGDPNGPVAPDSNGPGHNGGIGGGDDGGVGNGVGPGFGKNDGGGFTPGVDGVTAPKPIFSPAPNYSDEARKAKLQGAVILSLVVDAHGNPTHIQVVRFLGMGLDENAVEKTRMWRFTPGTRNGVPVPVRVTLEVTFRLF
ncbi:MAG TPA: energy transducer TonB [Terriglobia bacterium]|nr:energy transducer TonB [Terriglobia bacterium]